MAAAIPDDSDTRQRLLDAAEQIFADAGFSAATVRAVTAAADANLAAVHYHFGSKEKLFAAVIVRRLEPLNAQRLALLDAAEAAAAPHPACVETVLRAIARPVLELLAHPSNGGTAFSRIMSRCHAEPDNGVNIIVHEKFEAVFRRFLTALRKALPHLSEPTFRWRTHLVMGSFFFLASQGDYLRRHTDGICRLDDPVEAESQFVWFAAAGLSSPEP